MEITIQIEQRFWRRVEQTEDECWEWLGGLDKDGYGQMTIRCHGKQVCFRAHRLSLLIHQRPLEMGSQIDHLCRNKRCVRPDHLEVVTSKENNARSNSPSALNAKKTHCLRGHEFNATNSRIDKRGYRRCKLCECELRKKPERRAVHAAYMRKWLRRKRTKDN